MNPAVAIGHEIPPWTMEHVDPARMKTMAAILRDPYTVHWDRAGNERLGIGPRVVNQGPLNVGYIANMLMSWAGPDCVRRLTLAFARPVLDGDRVTARGVVSDLATVDGALLATCDVWLDREGEHVVTGTAVVRLTTASTDTQDSFDRTDDVGVLGGM
jgi:acyl dehydratase